MPVTERAFESPNIGDPRTASRLARLGLRALVFHPESPALARAAVAARTRSGARRTPVGALWATACAASRSRCASRDRPFSACFSVETRT